MPWNHKVLLGRCHRFQLNRTQEFYSWDGFRYSLQQEYSWRWKTFKYFTKWGGELRGEVKAMTAKQRIHSVLLDAKGAGHKLLSQAFHFYVWFFKPAFGSGQFQPINDFLSRHLDMAIKSFLLESCPHQPQEKKRPEGLYFFPLTSLEIIMETCQNQLFNFK